MRLSGQGKGQGEASPAAAVAARRSRKAIIARVYGKGVRS
jgi:hypothetical protein